VLFLLSAFSLAWFKAIGSVGNPMSSDSVEQLVIEHSAARCEAVSLRGDQGLKGFQCLNCALKADCSRLDVVLGYDCESQFGREFKDSSGQRRRTRL
jgi:hypothetical protein